VFCLLFFAVCGRLDLKEWQDRTMTRQEIATSILLAVVGIGATAAIQVAPALFPNHAQLIFYAGVTAIALAFFGLAITIVSAKRAGASAQNPLAPEPSVISHNQSGGITAHTVNLTNDEQQR